MNVWQSHPVDVVVEVGEFLLKSFSLSDTQNQILGLGISERKTFDLLPMVEDALREGLSLGVSTQHTGETE